ncbi:MAG: hypothetical protein JWM57_964 [Phycisphaerales bacterium]|nr:hypothetical protein [Phycisphaerales bacterium]
MNAKTKEQIQNAFGTLVIVAIILFTTGTGAKLITYGRTLINGNQTVPPVDPSLVYKPYSQQIAPKLMDRTELNDRIGAIVGTSPASTATQPGR